MAITLNEAMEQRIQRQLERGAFKEPREVLEHALDLLEAEEDWLLQNRETIEADLEESFAQAARDEGFTLDQAKAILAERRASRAA